MLKVLQYGGLTTKVRAMRGKLLKKSDYQRLTEAASVSEFVEQLKKHKTYEDVFFEVDPEYIHRGEMEKILTYSIYRDFSKIYKFANMGQRNFLKLYFMKYEVAMIKRAIRGLHYEDSQSYFDKAEVIFTEYSDVDIGAVYDATTVSQIIEALKGTIYYEPLKNVSEYAVHTVFDYEMALDIFVFKYIWKKKKIFNSKEQKIISEFVGTDIDLLNVLWIYRAKHYYKLSNAKIYDIIIPVNYRIKPDQIKALVEAQDVNEFMTALDKTKIGAYLRESSYGLNDLEKADKQLMHKLNNKIFSLNPYSIACVNTYMSEKDEEIKRLIKIAESIRYGYKSDIIIAEII